MILQNYKNNMPPSGYMQGQKNRSPNSLNFAGPRLPHQSFEEFEKFAKQTDFLKNLSEYVKEQHLVGEGKYHKVYSIPQNDTFLIRIKRNHIDDIHKGYPLIKSPNPFPHKNLGQKVAEIGKNIEIIIKQDGIPNGLEDRDNYKLKNAPLPKEKVPEVISKLQMVSQMPQNTYNTLANEVKTICKGGYLFDFYNPNNILIDNEKKALNIVDIDPYPSSNIAKKIFRHTSSNQLLMALFDTSIFLRAYKAANPEEKLQMQQLGQSIQKKVKATPLKKRNLLFLAKQKYSEIKHKVKYYSEHMELKRILNGKEYSNNVNSFLQNSTS
jgi:hypothetical protein